MVRYSMGAYIVGRLLVTNPDRVHTVIMVSGIFPTDDKEELLFQENTATDMELHGELALAAVVIEGADHHSNKAAVLHPNFLQATENMIGLGAQR